MLKEFFDDNAADQQCADLLEESEHACFMPDSLGVMTDKEIAGLFGAYTVERYRDDMNRRQSPSFRPDARNVLARIRRIDILLAKIDASKKSLRETQEIAPQFDGSVEKFLDTKMFRAAISEPNIQKTLKEVTNICRSFLDCISTSNTDASIAAAKELQLIIKSIFEFSEHARFFAKNANDDLPRALLNMEAENNASKQLSGKDNTAEHTLACAKRMAATGFFGAEDILKEMVGGPTFVQKMKDHYKRLMRDNWKKNSNNYRDFYIRMGNKHFKRFIDGTLGLALFSHRNSSDLEEWTAQDVRDLKKFICSRYEIVHNIMEGIANKNENPLGANFSKPQTLALMCETLRSSLYPNYKMDIRIGIGGTEEPDVLVRIGAYIMNALDIMSIYGTANEVNQYSVGVNVPELKLTSGAALAERINGLAPVVAEKNERNIFRFLKEFVATYYPEMKDKVSFVSPRQEAVFDNDLYKALLDAAREVTQPQNEEKQVWSEDYEKRGKACAALETLARFASKRPQSNDGEEEIRDRALRYSVAHVMPEVFQSVRFRDGYVAPVWKIGGHSEKYFNAFGEALVDLIQDDERFSLPNANNGPDLLAGICTTTIVGGNPPPYYRGPKDSLDLGLSEVVEGVRNNTLRDERIISRAQYEGSGPASDLNALLKHKRLGNGNTAEGWHKYKPFLMTCGQQ